MERVFISRVIHADANAVWAVMRDFNGLPEWHPAIADSTIEGGLAADAVGCVRSFHLADGGHIREQLTELSDADRRMRYIILEAPMPVTGYDASIEILPITEDGSSLVVWKAEFEAPPEAAKETAKMVADGVFRAGLTALAERLE